MSGPASICDVAALPPAMRGDGRHERTPGADAAVFSEARHAD